MTIFSTDDDCCEALAALVATVSCDDDDSSYDAAVERKRALSVVGGTRGCRGDAVAVHRWTKVDERGRRRRLAAVAVVAIERCIKIRCLANKPETVMMNGMDELASPKKSC